MRLTCTHCAHVWEDPAASDLVTCPACGTVFAPPTTTPPAPTRPPGRPLARPALWPWPTPPPPWPTVVLGLMGCLSTLIGLLLLAEPRPARAGPPWSDLLVFWGGALLLWVLGWFAQCLDDIRQRLRPDPTDPSDPTAGAAAPHTPPTRPTH